MGRGVDIPNVVLVINYNCPTYKEDYIHRVGRTGRAGNWGTAITFIDDEDDEYAKEIIEALQISNSPVPDELEKMHIRFREKVKRGEARSFKNKNNMGRGFKFDSEEFTKMKMVKKILSKSYGFDLNEDDEKEIEELQNIENT